MYASIQEIKAASRRLEAVLCAPDDEILMWGTEAKAIIDTFCSQDFSFEQCVTKVIRAEDYILYFNKPLSGTVRLVSQTCEIIEKPRLITDAAGNECLEYGDYYVFPGKPYILYDNANILYAPDSMPQRSKPDTLSVSGDWGFAPDLLTLIVALVNEIRKKYELHRMSDVFHNVADLGAPVTLPAATDLDSALDLMNELKAVMNLHMSTWGVHCGVVDEEQILSDDATDEDSAVTLLNEMKLNFNTHLLGVDPSHLVADEDNAILNSTSNPIIPGVIKLVFIKLVKRLALRDNIDDIEQMNSPYTSETRGDGYSYSVANGTLRNLLRPEDRELLWPFINHGVVVR